MNPPALTLNGISKSFDGVEVLRGVDFDLEPGEIHALVGENGAGKSTLMKVAAGIHHQDSGSMTLLGTPFTPRNPFDALHAGIAMVHQELSLAPDVTVAENILTGREPLRGGFIRWGKLYARAEALLTEFELNVAPDSPVSTLGAGYRQIVEVLKALASDPRIVIFDEPTSSLEAHESDLILQTIRRLADRGISVVYISHRMQEVFQIASRVTVLRDGGLVATKTTGETSIEEVVNAMVGREMSAMYPRKAGDLGEALLHVEGLSRRGKFRDVTFTLRRGEILGLSGLVGAGRTETMRAIFGADPIDSGSISIGGRLQRLQSWSVARAVAVGLAYLPEDRKTLGLFLDRSVEDNVASANLPRCSRGAMVDGSKTHDLATRSVRQLAIKVRDVEQEVSSLSGGNQQKVLLARWLATNPKVLIVDEPTRGVDIGAKSEIHRMLREYASQGNGVIVVSSEMPELLGLCDRILVMREGRIAGEASGSEMTEERLIEFAMGNASA